MTFDRLTFLTNDNNVVEIIEITEWLPVPASISLSLLYRMELAHSPSMNPVVYLIHLLGIRHAELVTLTSDLLILT